MPLSEDEQRILQQIEQQFYDSDPDFAGEIGKHSLYAHHWRRMKWALVTLVLGIVVLTVALYAEVSFFVAFGGFVLMLFSALWFERNLRKLGRAGMQQLSRTMKASGIRDALGNTRERMRGRFNRNDD